MIARRAILGGAVLGGAVLGGVLRDRGVLGWKLSAAAAGTVRARRVATLLTGAPPGATSDDIARLFARHLGLALDGADVQVRNIPGDGGRTALTALAGALPSGANVGWVATPVLPARVVDRDDPALLSRLTLLGSVEREPIVFVAAAANPLESVRDIVQRASQDSDALPLGTPPPGSPPHLAALRLQIMTQTRLNIVAFPSAAAARQALLGGNVTAVALGLSDVIASLRDDTIVGLGIAARDRSGIVPDMPVLSEAGVPLSAWIRRGLAVPAGTPHDVCAILIEALRTVAADDAFGAAARAMGLLAAWTDAPAWTAQLERERTELAAMWAADPWLSAAGQ